MIEPGQVWEYAFKSKTVTLLVIGEATHPSYWRCLTLSDENPWGNRQPSVAVWSLPPDPKWWGGDWARLV